ncbi:YlcI/YnfO family protein [Vibrio marisflavi]|uniref:Recombinase domain-containing protein n=1 Tax=Vibrio marisflavi CECT 7928 TaxID=634439 RepID=A0ABM9A0X3_9VIBR|nr:YlcI/YnfO family protein [Vibrio marisflavi]CAH0536593.1 hypothetical protein VMF7928_00548 [Vibrio marisflavi CECT 7928]
MKKYVITLNSNTNRKTAKKNIRFEHDLLIEIQEVKSNKVTFSAWVKQACRFYINHIVDVENAVCTDTRESEANVRTLNHETSSQEQEKRNEIKELVNVLYDSGMYYQQIADILNQRGLHASSGSKWSRVAVKRLIEVK